MKENSAGQLWAGYELIARTMKRCLAKRMAVGVCLVEDVEQGLERMRQEGRKPRRKSMSNTDNQGWRH